MSTYTAHSVNTSRLEIEYLEWNPQGRRTAVLVHGWPDSVRTWFTTAPLLASAGYRVIAPSVRGYAGTRFLSADTPRSGQLAALGRDLVEFVQALRQVGAPLSGTKAQARELAGDVQRARAALAHAIAQDPLPPPAPGADLAKDAAWSTYLQRHLELQRKMDRLIDPLREHVRQALGRTSTRLRQLAAMDVVLAQTLAARQERLLPTLPALLQRRYEDLRAQHRQALLASGAEDDPAQWRAEGAWLHRFEQDWRQALMAEVDLRLEPVLGLVEALAQPPLRPLTDPRNTDGQGTRPATHHETP